MSQGKQPDTKSTDAAFSSDVSGVTVLSALICSLSVCCWTFYLRLFCRTAVTKVKDEALLGRTVIKQAEIEGDSDQTTMITGRKWNSFPPYIHTTCVHILISFFFPVSSS